MDRPVPHQCFGDVQRTSGHQSSARAMTLILRKIAAISITFAVFLSVLFIPTRLNCADDPTRSVPLRSSRCGLSFLSRLGPDGIFQLAELSRMRRWIANWTALLLGLCVQQSLRLGSFQTDQPRFRSPLPSCGLLSSHLGFRLNPRFPW